MGPQCHIGWSWAPSADMRRPLEALVGIIVEARDPEQDVPTALDGEAPGEGPGDGPRGYP
jgi:hypothetical protein